MGRVYTVLSVSLAALAACHSSELALLDDVGDPCRSAYGFCNDEMTALVCESNVWVERDCESVCAELGPAYEASGCDIECVCTLIDPSSCTPGDSTCVDESTVGVCDDNQELSATPCSEVCANAGLNEVGCLDDAGEGSCWCTAEGTPCSPESLPTCVDAETIANCEAGIWEFVECAVICDGPGVCDPYGQAADCDC